MSTYLLSIKAENELRLISFIYRDLINRILEEYTYA